MTEKYLMLHGYSEEPIRLKVTDLTIQSPGLIFDKEGNPRFDISLVSVEGSGTIDETAYKEVYKEYIKARK